MKKELLTLAIALFCFGCQKQSTKSTRDENANWSDSITHYTEQVRQGNRMAYLRLAEGFIAMKKNQTDEAIEIFGTLNRKGSRMARFFAAILRQDMDAMSVAAKDFPPLYNELARMCIERTDSSNTNVLEAEAFYLKAEEQACLDDGGVQFLLGYYDYVTQKGEREVDPKVIERLKKMSKNF
ncbi:MAG: hypothetical protein IJV33_00285 [Bacteroidaceae bacterium]|nr:hypothetical protein [Bacteroidaceae bacterium]